MSASKIAAFAVPAALGFGLGYLSKPGAASIAEDARASTPAPAAAPPLTAPLPRAPSWWPGLGADLGRAETAEDFKTLLLDLFAQPDSAERDEWIMVALARWIDRGGAAAFDVFKDYGSWSSADHYKSAHAWQSFALHRLALKDIDAAIERCGTGVASPALSLLVLERHPQHLQTLFKERAFDGDNLAWRKAGEIAATLDDDEGRELLRQWLRDDRQRFKSGTIADFADGFVAGRSSEDLETLAKRFAGQGGSNNDRSIRGTGGVPARSRAISAALGELAQTDPGRATELAMEIGDRPANNLLAARLLEQDREAGLEFFIALSGGATNPLGRATEVLPTLAELGPDELVRLLDDPRWGDAHPTHAYGLQTLGYKIAPADSARWVAELDSLPPSPARDALLVASLARWGRMEPEAAATRAEQLLRDRPDLADRALGPLALVLGADDDRLFRVLDQHPSEHASALLTNALTGWQSSHPERAAAAFSARLDHPAVPEATRFLVDRWASDGLAAPSRWLADLPPGPARDAGIAGLLPRLVSADPEAMGLWVAEISTPEAQLEALNAAIDSPFQSRTPESIAATIEHAPAEHRDALRAAHLPPEP